MSLPATGSSSAIRSSPSSIRGRVSSAWIIGSDARTACVAGKGRQVTIADIASLAAYCHYDRVL